MPKITTAEALQLIENERGIVRVLRSDPSDYSDLMFELKQFADPENVRPIRPLEPYADRTQVYDFKLKTFVPRTLNRAERGQPQPGNQRIKAVSGSLPPQDGKMRFYNHAKSNQGHKHVIYGVDAGANPDRYLYRHKKDPSIDVKDEPCLIVACYDEDAGTNTKWHIKGQPLNVYHKGRYPEAKSFEHLREDNRVYRSNFYVPERNEIKFKPSVAALQFVGSVSDSVEDRVNALHFKLLIWQILKIDLPVIIFDEFGKHSYSEKDQAKDILIAFSRGISFAFDIHDYVLSGNVPADCIFTKYQAMYIDYCDYVKQIRLLNSDATLNKFFEYHEAKSKSPSEEKALSVPLAAKVTPQCISDAKASVLGRKMWGEIVSQTYDYEKANPQDNSTVLARLKEAGLTGDLENIYQDMCAYLQSHTRIVVAFDAKKIIQQMPVSLHYLNLSEIDAQMLQQDRKLHLKQRNEIEDITFSYLKDVGLFEKNNQARPHYAYLTFCNEDNYPKSLTKDFGSSYFVLRDVVKFNSVFVPQNVYRGFTAKATTSRPCTYFNFDVLLNQASNELLLGIAHAVTKQLPKNQIRENAQFEMHAYIPSMELFDRNVVERIYVSPDEYKMSGTEVAFLEGHGIKVCNVGTHAYAQDEIEITAAMRADDVAGVQSLLKKAPFLRYTSTRALEQGDAVLYHYLLRHDPQVRPISWQEMLERIPPNEMHLFHPVWSEAELKSLTDEDLVRLRAYKDKIMEPYFNPAFQLFLTWLKQFNAANIKMSDIVKEKTITEKKVWLEEKLDIPNLLLGSFFGGIVFHDAIEGDKGEPSMLISLLQSGLLPLQHLPDVAFSLFINPKYRLVTHYLIQKKYYQLTHEASEKEALFAGENYNYVLDDPRMAALVSWNSATTFNIVKELLMLVDDTRFLEKSFLNMGAALAFSAMQDYHYNDLFKCVAEKNPALLFVFTAAINSGVPLRIGNVLIDNTLTALAKVTSAHSFKHFLETNMKGARVSFQDEEKQVDELLQLPQSSTVISVADWQTHFLHILHNEPNKLRQGKYIELFCANLPSFDFLHKVDPVRYSIACMKFYFPGLVQAWIAKPQLLCFSQLQELIVHCMRTLDKGYINDVLVMLDLHPELIHTQVPGSHDSLLHIAVAVRCKNDAIIRRLMGSNVAHLNNTAGRSVLQNLTEMNMQAWYHGGSVPTELHNFVSEILQVIPFSNEQLISVLNAMTKTYKNGSTDYVQQICAVLNKNQAQGDALNASFLSALSGSKALWKSYLQIKSISQSVFAEAIKTMVGSTKSVFSKQDIHDVLDCATNFDYHVIIDYLKLEYSTRLNFSHILSHPNCHVTDPVIISRLVSEFADIVSTKSFTPDVAHQIIENFLIVLDKLHVLSELKQRSDFIKHHIVPNSFSVVLLLLRNQFAMSEESWDLIPEKYAEVIYSPADEEMRSALIAILQMQPQRIATAWDIFYKKQLDPALLSDATYARKMLRKAKQSFCEGFQIDAALSAKIDAEMVKVISAVTQSTAQTISVIRWDIKFYDFLDAISLVMPYDQYLEWKGNHKEVIATCDRYKKHMSVSSEEKEDPIENNMPINVLTEAGLNKLIAALENPETDATVWEDARAQLKTKLANYDAENGVVAYWHSDSHFTHLRIAIKTYYVLCKLEPPRDDAFTRLRVSYYYFMLNVVAYNKDEVKVKEKSLPYLGIFARNRGHHSLQDNEKNYSTGLDGYRG